MAQLMNGNTWNSNGKYLGIFSFYQCNFVKERVSFPFSFFCSRTGKTAACNISRRAYACLDLRLITYDKWYFHRVMMRGKYRVSRQKWESFLRTIHFLKGKSKVLGEESLFEARLTQKVRKPGSRVEEGSETAMECIRYTVFLLHFKEYLNTE